MDEQPTKKKEINYVAITKYVFLLVLVLLVLKDAIFIELLGIKAKHFPGSVNQLIFVMNFVFVISGLFTYWAHRKQVRSFFQKEEETKDEQDKLNADKCAKSWPKLVKTPVLGKMFLAVCRQGKLVLVSLLILVVVGLSLRIYGVGDFDFRSDEFQVISAAKTYSVENDFYRWDWLANKSSQYVECLIPNNCQYTRAWPHTSLVGYSFRFFGVSEFNARIVSVFFGGLMILVAYWMGLFFLKSKKWALLFAALIALSPTFIQFSRFIRMYILMVPFFMAAGVFMYRGLAESTGLSGKSKLTLWIKKYAAFHYKYLLAFVVMLAASTMLHVNAGVILIIASMFVIIMAAVTRLRKFSALVALGALTVALLSFLLFFNEAFVRITWIVLKHISFFGRENMVYLAYITDFPISGKTGLLMLILGGSLLLWIVNKSFRYRMIYLNVFVWTSVVFFVYMANRYASVTYILHIIPFSLLLMVFGYMSLFGVFLEKWQKLVLMSLMIVSVGSIAISSYPNLYKENVSHSLAYVELLEEYQPGQIIMSKFAREYYFKDLGDVPTLDLGKNKDYPYSDFIYNVDRYKTGWVIWETAKTHHMKDAIVNYVSDNFKQYHGRNFDDIGVEVYFFDQSMIK